MSLLKATVTLPLEVPANNQLSVSPMFGHRLFTPLRHIP